MLFIFGKANFLVMRIDTLQSPFHHMPEKSVEFVNTAVVDMNGVRRTDFSAYECLWSDLDTILCGCSNSSGTF